MSLAVFIRGFGSYLKLERSLSPHSVEAYLRDVDKLRMYMEMNDQQVAITDISYEHLQSFIHWLNELGLEASSQARIISGLKAFFKYLILEDVLQKDPAELVEAPRLSRKLPQVLSVEEISRMLGILKLEQNTMLRLRNTAIIETLYACGLRVSELTALRLTNLYFDAGFIKITGKGNKERLVPIGENAVDAIHHYLSESDGRPSVEAKPGHEDILFLNRRGRQLTRVMVFTIVKQLAGLAGISKKVSPHTFRHSFATHLIEGGANLRAIQEMLGHESIITTEIYTHLDTDYLRDTILTYHPRNQ